MNLLALDTSSIACTVALQVGKTIAERHEEQPREHTRLLVPMIRSLLDESAIELADLDAIVLGNGPGSFIGMRIAASVAQGIAFGSGINIVPASSLAVVAAQVFAEHDAAEVVVTQDAHMSEVYLGSFVRDEKGIATPVFDERLHGQDAISELGQMTEGWRYAAGSGWQRYPLLLEHNLDRIHQITEIVYPRARYLLEPGANAVEKGETVLPADVVPAYLRQKVAQIPARP